jgi:REP element-mobilizing transposase RayT
MIRGIEKRDIFMDDDDRSEFFRRMGVLAEKTSTDVYAYALMNNHVHILLKSSLTGMPTFMRCLLSGYAQYFNRKHQRVGHLFQNRYKSVVCEEDLYFRKLIAYINLNPLRGGLVCSIQELGVYPWCSHARLMGQIRDNWYQGDYVLTYFGKSKAEARLNYVAYIEDELPHDRQDELNGGGLLRSHGGWSQVCSMRRHGDREMSDERILGSGDFVKEILDQAEDKLVRQLPLKEALELAQKDIEVACSEAGIPVSLLCSGGRNRSVTGLRLMLVARLVNERGLTYAETARQLGITTSAVSQMMTRIKRDEELAG